MPDEGEFDGQIDSNDSKFSSEEQHQNLVDLIIKLLQDVNFITEVELVTEITKYSLDIGWPLLGVMDIIEVLRSLSRDGHIVALDYIPASMPYRSKTLYFPAGTQILGELFYA